MSSGDIGKLYMTNSVQVVSQRMNQVTFHYLHMIDIVLQLNIRMINGLKQSKRLTAVVKKKTGNILGVNRFCEYLYALISAGFSTELQVINKGFLC